MGCSARRRRTATAVVVDVGSFPPPGWCLRQRRRLRPPNARANGVRVVNRDTERIGDWYWSLALVVCCWRGSEENKVLRPNPLFGLKQKVQILLLPKYWTRTSFLEKKNSFSLLYVRPSRLFSTARLCEWLRITTDWDGNHFKTECKIFPDFAHLPLCDPASPLTLLSPPPRPLIGSEKTSTLLWSKANNGSLPVWVTKKTNPSHELLWLSTILLCLRYSLV